jgi:uncharacterized protein
MFLEIHDPYDEYDRRVSPLRRGEPSFGITVMSTSVVIARHGIVLPMDRIAELCRRLDVEELAIFGSYLRDDFRPESDVDFLAVFRNDDPGPWMSKLQQFERELGEILGRKIDVTLRRDVEASENWIRRQNILGSARVICHRVARSRVQCGATS